MTDTPADGPGNPRLDALTLDLERHAAADGWDQPPHLFALVETADLLRREPQLAAQLGLAEGRPGDLTPVDQGDLREAAATARSTSCSPASPGRRRCSAPHWRWSG